MVSSTELSARVRSSRPSSRTDAKKTSSPTVTSASRADGRRNVPTGSSAFVSFIALRSRSAPCRLSSIDFAIS